MNRVAGFPPRPPATTRAGRRRTDPAASRRRAAVARSAADYRDAGVLIVRQPVLQPVLPNRRGARFARSSGAWRGSRQRRRRDEVTWRARCSARSAGPRSARSIGPERREPQAIAAAGAVDSDSLRTSACSLPQPRTTSCATRGSATHWVGTAPLSSRLDHAPAPATAPSCGCTRRNRSREPGRRHAARSHHGHVAATTRGVVAGE